MKSHYFVLLLLLPIFIPGLLSAQQIIILDDFEDNDLTNNPEWTGDLGNFSFFEDNGNQLLRLTAPEAGSSQLRTESAVAYGTWEFFIDQDFPPSNGNRGFIYLMSDQEDLSSGSINGYAIRTGENSSPNFFRLFRFTNGAGTEILTGELDISSGGPYRVRVARDTDGEWSLYESEGYDSTPLYVDSETDNTHTTSSHFGFNLTYTATRANNFYFDDFIIRDGILPLELISYELDSPREIRLIFTEPVDETSLNVQDFELNGTNPQSVSVPGDQDNAVVLEFENQFPDGELTLVINNIDDFRGNTIEANTELTFEIENPFTVENLEIVSATEIDVIFSEDVEAGSLNGSTFSISDGVGEPANVSLPSANTVRLEYSEQFSTGDRTLTINDLESVNGWVIDDDTEVDFEISNPFEFVSFNAISNSVFDIEFSEDIDEATIDVSAFNISDDIGQPDNAELESSNTIRISFDTALTSGERTLTFSDISSENGWTIPENTEHTFFLFDEFEEGDIVINEFWYRGGQPRYVELLNTTDKVFNLQNWELRRRTGGPSNGGVFSTDELALQPQGFLVITNDADVMENEFGEGDYLEMSSYPGFTQTTPDTVRLLTPQNSMVDFVPYDPGTWPGNGVAIERISPDAISFTVENWADSEDPRGGTPGEANTTEIPDDEPILQIAEFLTESSVRLRFNKSIAENSVSNLDNYDMSDGISVTAAERVGTREIHLDLDSDLTDGETYQITVSGIEDIFSNVMDETQVQFVYYDLEPVVPGDLAINEFWYRGGNPRYVEIINTSDKVIDIARWELRRNQNATTNTGGRISPNKRQFLMPGSYIVVSPDTTTLRSRFGSRPYFQTTTFPGLSTTGDVLRLLTPDGDLSQRIPYETSWGGNNVALERTTLDVTEQIQDNWRESIDPLGGSPGLDNTVSAPATAPQVQEVTFPLPAIVRVRLNRVLTDDSIADLTNFSFSGDHEIESITKTSNPRILEMELDGNLVDQTDYQLTIQNAVDFFGNEVEGDVPFDFFYQNPFQIHTANILNGNELEMQFTQSLEVNTVTTQNFELQDGAVPTSLSFPTSDKVRLTFEEDFPAGPSEILVSNIQSVVSWQIEDSSSFTFFLFDEFEPGDIVINEFYTRPPEELRVNDARPQFVEIRNTTDKYLDLTNWSIQRITGSPEVISTVSKALEPDQYLVLTRNVNVFTDLFGEADYFRMDNFPRFNLTTEDQIVLRNNEGETIDSLRIGASNWAREGVSTERRSATAPSFLIENWGFSEDETGATPGRENSKGPLTEPSEFLSAGFETASRVLVRFSTALDVEIANDTERFEIDGGLSVEEVEVINPRQYVLVLSDDMISGNSYTISVNNLPDIFGNMLTSAEQIVTFYTLEPVAPGDIVINEFMYNEPDGYTIYIELYNQSEKALDIAGWKQANDTGTRRTLTNTRHIIPPDSFIVILPNTILLELFPDINYVNAGSNLSALKNGGDEIVITDADGVVLDSLRYSPSWGGNGVALERINPDVRSTFAENWANSNAELLGTPGQRNTVTADDIKPEVRLVTYHGADSLNVIFTKNLDEASMTSLDNYSMSGDLSVQTIRQRSGREVGISLSGNMENGSDYTISFENIADPFGNVIADTSVTFTYFDVTEARAENIFINEFMFRPPSGYTRYVELYNSSDQGVSVQNWTISNDTGNRQNITSNRLIIPPDSFLVILPSVDLQSIFPDMNSVVLSNMPATKSGGDDIVIRDAEGVVLDSISYQPNWGGNGVSLERISREVSGIFRDNWANSPALEFGTPGARNQVEPDTETPVVLDAFPENPNVIRLIFSKVMDEESASDLSNYSLSGASNITAVNWQRRQVFLTIQPDLEADENYTLEIEPISDLFGNQSEQTSVNISLVTTQDAVERDVVINEFLYRPLEGEVTRFVELYNRSDKNVNLNQWIIGRGTGSPATITRGTAPDGAALPIILEPEEHIIITGNSDWIPDGVRSVVLSSFPSLSSLGDAIFIRDNDGQLVDSLNYRNSWGGNEAGLSVERIDPNGASNDPSNWRSSPSGFSAGRQNVAFEPVTTEPELIFAGITADGNIRIRTNRFVNIDDETEFSIGNRSLQVLDYSRFRGNNIILSLPNNSSVLNAIDLNPDEDEMLNIRNLGDFSGNVAESVSLPIARRMQEGDVVINEFLYQPLSATDSRSAQSEFVEFYNTRDYAISMEGFFIHDEPDPDGSISRIVAENTNGAWIPSGGYLVLHADPAPVFADSRIARFFELEESRQFYRASRNSLSLSTTGDEIYLADSTGTVIDFLRYLPSWHNPNRVDVRGVSLERINPFGDSNNPDNWSSSTRDRGATPGQENTIFSIPTDFSEDAGVVMEPNPFSPDGDGFEDNLFINYTLDEPDYLLRVRIFDRYGRLVKTLADGQIAGLQGTLIWDGMKDDGSSNRIGIYVVLFEAYNSATGRNQTFKETVVLARQL